MATETANSSKINIFFSPCGADTSNVIVGWVVFNWANSATVLCYSVFQAILINDLGDKQFGDGAGKILWSYLSVILIIITALLYLSFTPMMEYGFVKRKALVRCGIITSISLILFIFCFSSGSVYIASILVIVSYCCQRVADVAYDSLLDTVAKDKDAHQISTRGYITGYIGMLTFIVSVSILLYILYITTKLDTLWLTGIIPIVASGVWYLIFLSVVSSRIPIDFSEGVPIPDFLNNNLAIMAIVGFRNGLEEQIKSIAALHEYKDLGFFILAMAFISDAAATATSSAAIIATSVLNLSLAMVAAAALIGVFTSVCGLFFYKFLHSKNILTPKTTIIINVIILCLCAAYLLQINTLIEVFIVAAVGGSQIGPLGSFSRSIISRLLPSHQQSKYFSLYNLTQKGSGWIGPLIIGALTQSFGNSSYLKVVVVVTIAEAAIGIPIFFIVNIIRGETKRYHSDVIYGSNNDVKSDLQIFLS